MTKSMSWDIKKNEDALIGNYFVTAKDGEIHNQGCITEVISPDAGFYKITLFSWLDGSPNGSRIVSFDNIVKFFILTGNNIEEHNSFCERNRDKKLSVEDFSL